MPIYKSDMTLAELKDMLVSSVDIPTDALDSFDDDGLSSKLERLIVLWVTELEQMIYSSYIQNIEKKKYSKFPIDSEGEFSIGDIKRVFLYDEELAKGTGKTMVPMSYFAYNDVASADEKDIFPVGKELIDIFPPMVSNCDITVYYNKKPKPKKYPTHSDESYQLAYQYINLPKEWLKLVIAYCKYKLCSMYNEDTQAGKYLNEYNAYLQDFAVWISKHLDSTF